MNLPQVYMCSPSWTLLPPPSPYHPSGSSQCTSPKHPVSCIEPGLTTRFIHDILHVSMPFSQIFPPSPSPTESIRLFYTSVSLLLSRTQGYCYHLSKNLRDLKIIYMSIWDPGRVVRSYDESRNVQPQRNKEEKTVHYVGMPGICWELLIKFCVKIFSQHILVRALNKFCLVFTGTEWAWSWQSCIWR